MAAAATKTRDDRFLERAEKRVKENANFQFTPEALARLQQLEDEARQDPNVQIQFAAVSDFLQQWALLNPEERDRLGKQFQDQANSLVDIPFDTQTKDLQDGLARQLKALNTKYQFMDDADAEKLTQSLGDLDRDTVTQLTNAFENIEARGLGNSGLLRQAADAIMNDRETAVAKANELFQLGKSQNAELKRQSIEDEQARTAIEQRGIDQERTVAREEKKNELVDRAVQTDLLTQIMSGATDLAPKTFTPNALNPDTLPTPETVIPADPVLTPAQRIRNIRLGISGNTAPTPKAPAPQEPTTIPAPVAPAPTKNTTSTAGMTADQRRQIRLNRLQQSI